MLHIVTMIKMTGVEEPTTLTIATTQM